MKNKFWKKPNKTYNPNAILKQSLFNKIRFDGKTVSGLFWMCLFGGIIGGEYFYLNMKKLAWIKLGISWFGATFIVVTWLIYASVDFKVTTPTGVVVEHYNFSVILGLSLAGGFFVILTTIWSIYNMVLIVLGKFKDEHKNVISSWNTSKNEFVLELLKL